MRIFIEVILIQIINWLYQYILAESIMINFEPTITAESQKMANEEEYDALLLKSNYSSSSTIDQSSFSPIRELSLD